MEVAIPAGSNAAAVISAFETAAASPATVLANIQAAASSSGSSVDLSEVEITEMAAPVAQSGPLPIRLIQKTLNFCCATPRGLGNP